MPSAPTVAHSTPAWLPRTQTWIYNQIKSLQENGSDIHVVADRIENPGEFDVEHLRCRSRVATFAERRLAVLPVLPRFAISRLLLHTVLKSGARIVHSHFGNQGWRDIPTLRLLRKMRPGIRHVVTFYGYDVQRLPTENPAWKRRYRELFEEVDLVLCEGSHMAQSIRALGCPSRKIDVLHVGVDLAGIRFEPRRLEPGEPVRVLIAAAFREKKGIPDALGALRLLAEAHDLEVTVIGDASDDPASHAEKARILDCAERGSLAGRVRLLGWKTHAETFAEAYAHHLFLHPSVTAANGDCEGGSPVVLTEMLATGMIAIATRHCDIPEVMAPFPDTLLGPEHDIAGLAERLRWAVENSRQWTELAVAARAWVEREYSLQVQTLKLAKIYASLQAQREGWTPGKRNRDDRVPG